MGAGHAVITGQQRGRGEYLFEKSHLDALFEDLERSHGSSGEYDRLLKQAHLAIALSDSKRQLNDEFDPIVVELIERHRPAG